MSTDFKTPDSSSMRVPVNEGPKRIRSGMSGCIITITPINLFDTQYNKEDGGEFLQF